MHRRSRFSLVPLVYNHPIKPANWCLTSTERRNLISLLRVSAFTMSPWIAKKANSRPYGSRAIEIIRRVYDVCVPEKKDGKVALPLSNAHDRTTSFAAFQHRQRNVFEKKKSRPAKPVHPRKFNIDDFDLCVLRRIVHKMYEKYQVLTTLVNFRNEFREAI